MTNNKQLLTSWQLAGFYPYTPLLKTSKELGKELANITPWVDASVPGSVQLDLHRAGLIDDPYVDQNSILCEWVEHRWWVYQTTFDTPSFADDEILELTFEGIDYKARIILNDVMIATHESIVKPLKIDVSKHMKEDEPNKLVVMFEHVPDVMGQVGYTSRCDAQKSRFNYKWDFTARLVNIGLFKPVYLNRRKKVHFKDVHIDPVVTDVEAKTGLIRYHVAISQAKENLSLSLFLDDVMIEERSGISETIQGNTDEQTITLWTTHDKGTPHLHDIKVVLKQDGKPVDAFTQRTGFKKLTFAQNENAIDALPYTFRVNDENVYIKGVNMVPIDSLFGHITNEKYERLIDMAVENNINFIRVWGGGLIEHDYFYELCNRHGIMVWQEFLQSSSGIDNIPNTDDAYMKDLKENSIAAVKKLRNHVSLALWCAGNELTDKDYVPSTTADPNVKMLDEIVKKYDPSRFMFPTSASGPLEFGDTEKKGLNHDIHGTWRFEGNEEHYRYYNEIDSLFHGEFGVEGMCSLASFKSFLSEDHLGPYDNNDFAWRHHGGEWWDSKERDETLFGHIEDLEEHIHLSQFIQQEGIRYALESNRRRAFENSGSIVWQLNEPYPNVSCTALVDYYFRAKPALAAVKKAYRRLNPSLRYDKLIYDAGETIETEFHVTSDDDLNDVNAEVRIYFDDKLHTSKHYQIKHLTSPNQKIDTLLINPKQTTKGIRIHMTIKTKNDVDENDVLLLVRQENGFADQDTVIDYMDNRLYATEG